MAKPTQELALTALIVGAGALLPIQALINARLGVRLGSPLWGAATQNFVGVLVMLGVIAVLRPAAPSPGQVAAVPLWAWLGGAMGMIYVISAMTAAPQLGAGRTITGAVVGQILCAMLLDHFGVLNERRPINLTMIAGVVLLIAGAALILRRA